MIEHKPFFSAPYSYEVKGTLDFRTHYELGTWVGNVLYSRFRLFKSSPVTRQTPLQQEVQEFLSVFAPLWEGDAFSEGETREEQAQEFSLLFPLEWQERVVHAMASAVSAKSEMESGWLSPVLYGHTLGPVNALDAVLVEFKREKNFMMDVAAAAVRAALEASHERQRQHLGERKLPTEVQRAIEVLKAAGYEVTPKT